MLKAKDWISKNFNKFYDIDDAFGSQCWDLFAKFCEDAGYPVFYCTKTGYVADLWTQRKTSGILKYFDEVSINNLKAGDWIVWTTSPFGTGKSHIAMFVSYAGTGHVHVLGTNQTANQKASYKTLSKKGIGGCLRPKCYVKNFLNPFYDKKVIELQKALNKDLKLKLAVDGWCGEMTQKAMGSFKVYPYPSKNYKKYPNIVKFVQKRLGGLAVDGSLGPATKAKIVSYQKSKKLEASGNIYFATLWELVK